MGQFASVSGESAPLVISAEGGTVTIPDAHLLFSGDFVRRGDDLVLSGEAGEAVIVVDYFGAAGLPRLAAPDGASLSPEVVSALAGPRAPGQYAQADEAQAQAPDGIGRVVTLTGSASAQRSDGTEVGLQVDSQLRQGDVVRTGPDSALGIVFADGTVFNLNADARMVLNELVYDPGGSSNSMLFSLVQGAFAFVAGQVAPTGEMRIDTPVATMGIRGTSVITKIGAVDGVVVFRLVPDPVTNRLGSFVLYEPGTNNMMVVIERADGQWEVDGTGAVIETPPDPGDDDIIQQLHDTFVQHAGIPTEQGEEETQEAQTEGSGVRTSSYLTTTEAAIIVSLSEGALAETADAPGGESLTSGATTEESVTSDDSESFKSLATTTSATTTSPPPPLVVGDATITGTATGSVAEDGTRTVTGRLTVSDPNPGEAGTQPITIRGTHGTFAIDGNGEWVYTLANDDAVVQALVQGQTESDVFVVVSTDGSAFQVVTITIAGSDDVPTISGTTTGSVTEDGVASATGTIDVADRDAGQSGVQPLSNVAGTYGTFAITAAGVWTYTLNNADAAVQQLKDGDAVTDSFIVTSADGSVTETVTVTVHGADDTAAISGTATGSASEDGTTPVSGTVIVTDPDAGEAAVQPLSGADGSYGTFSIDADGLWTYVLDNTLPAVQALRQGETVSDEFVVTSADGSASETVVITVAGTNDVPTMTGTTTGSLTEDSEPQSATGSITVSDVDSGESAVQPLSAAGTYGTFSIDAEGLWTYTLDNTLAATQALKDGESANDSFVVTSADGSATETVIITVHGADDTATISGATTGSVIEDATNSATGTLTVSDPDAGEAAVQPLTDVAGAYGTFSITAAGVWTYTPGDAVQALTQDETVHESFIVTSADASAEATVVITVTGTNDVPAITGTTTGSLSEDGEIVTATGDLAVSDPDSGESAVQPLTDEGTYGTFSITADGQWSYDLDNASAAVQGLSEGETVDDSFIVTSADGTASETVVITVTGVNDAPVAADDHFTTNKSNPAEGNVLDDNGNGADSDLDEDPLTVVRVNGTNNVGTQIALASGALLALQADGSFAYDPNGQFDSLGEGETASDSFTYTISDGNGGTATATATIEISGSNTPPTATASLVATNADMPASGLLTGTDEDAGDTLTFSEETAPSNGELIVNADGSYTYTPHSGFTGTDSFTYSVTDGLASDTATVTVEVAPVGAGEEPKDITGTDGNDVLIGSSLNDILRGGLGNDVLRSGGAPQTFDGADRLFGGPGDDTLTAEGGWAALFGGPGNDVLNSTDEGGAFDFVRADYRSSPAGITANLTSGLIGGLASGEVADGFGSVDEISNIHVLADSGHNDAIHVDSSYTNSFGNWIEVRLSGGDDGVIFDGVAVARISYADAQGPVLLDLQAGTATDLNPGDDFIGNDTIVGATQARGSRFGDTLLGHNTNDNELRGSGGDDTIDGRGGTNTIQYGDSTAGIYVDLAKNVVVHDGIWIDALGRYGMDQVDNVHNVRGSTWDDWIVGDAGNNLLQGGAGNDYVDGGAGQDEIHGGSGDDILVSGGAISAVDKVNNTYAFFEQDSLFGGEGNDTLLASSGDVVMTGGPGDDVIASTDDGGFFDFTRVSYRTSPSGISVAADGQGGLSVQDGFGGTDTVFRVHVLHDSAHSDAITVDSTYQTSFGTFLEVRLSGGDDTVTFGEGFAGRIGYQGAGGAILADLEAGTATDLGGGNHIGSDEFFGTVGTLRGSHFDDELYGSSGNDRFRGEGGNDIIDGRGGMDAIQFGGSNFGVHVDLSQDTVFDDGLGGADSLTSIENVDGSPFDDLIIGDANANRLNGSNGDDTIHGGGANDFLHGGEGADELRGGMGDDHLVSGGATGGFDKVNNTYSFFEQDSLFGGDGNDTLEATGGDVIMVGGAGNDEIRSFDTGESWFDFIRVSYASSTSGIVAGMDSLGGGDLIVQDGLGGVDTVSGVHVLHDSTHGDTITVDASYETSFGPFLEVRLSGGDDTVTFGEGFAGRIGYQGAGGAVHADLEAGTATDRGAGNHIGSDEFFGTVGTLRGSHFDDLLEGSSGNDRLRGEGGNDIIDGRGGIDAIQFGGSESAIVVDLSQGTVADDGLGGADTLISIENVDGSPFDDLITGDTNANRLNGSLGDDTIQGGAGNDSLDGGEGGDELHGGIGDDHLVSGGATGGFDTINNTYSFVEQDRLFGGAGNDTLEATGGDVLMIGGAGDDEITSSDSGESWFDFSRVSYHTSTAGIVVGMLGTGLTVQDGLGGTDTVSRMHLLHDSDLGDAITINSDYETSLGNFIEVRLTGGDDTVTFDNVDFGRIGYQGAGGAVWADLELGEARDLVSGDTFIGEDTFIGKVHILRGSRFDDELYGSNDNDLFRGEGGNDFIDGRGGIDGIQYAGADTGVHVDLSRNRVFDDGAGGSDTLASIENVFGSPFDDLIFGDGGNNLLNGGLGNDVLRSGGAPQTWQGGDRLEGGQGNDTLVAEGGFAVLVGGPGHDLLRSTDQGLHYDFVRADYANAPSRIIVNLTAGAIAGLASGTALDGFGDIDQIWNIHVVADTWADDEIYVDSSYTNSFGNWIEVRLSGGDDTVVFDNVDTARISYAQAGGAVSLNLGTGIATDLNSGDGHIGTDTFSGATVARGSRFGDELTGSAGNDELRGSGGDDTINGMGGTNIITFGDSEFGIHVDLSQNMVLDDGIFSHELGRHGQDVLQNIQDVRGSDWNDVIVGDGVSNRLHGGLGDDSLVGGLGDDVLTGGFGDDALTGGPGADRFTYRAPDEGIDTIADFVSGEDALAIDASTFGGGLVPGQSLSDNQLVSDSGPTATQFHGQFLYDTDTGALYWDSDGLGNDGPVQLASLTGAPSLSSADFVIEGDAPLALFSTTAIVDTEPMSDPVVTDDGTSTDTGSTEEMTLATMVSFDSDVMVDDGSGTGQADTSTDSGTGASTDGGTDGFTSLGTSDLSTAVDPGTVEYAA